MLDSNNQLVDLKVGYSAMNHKLDSVFGAVANLNTIQREIF